MALGKVGKGVIATLATVTLVGGVFAGVYHFVPEVKEKVDNSVENLINKIKDKFQGGSNGTGNNGTNNKNDESADNNSNNNKNDNSNNSSTDIEEQKKNEERKDKIQNDERLEGFDDEKKGEIADKFDKVSESDEYKDMSDEEKDKLVDKLIESEKIQQDIVKEQENQDQRQEELKSDLGGISEELGNVLANEELSQSEQVAQVAEAIDVKKTELEKTISSPSATTEEIAAAQEQLDQLTSLEQEYATSQMSNSLTNNFNSDEIFQRRNGDMILNQINGIYWLGTQITIDAQFIKTETTAGVEIYSQINCFMHCNILKNLDDMNSYVQIIDDINNNSGSWTYLSMYTDKSEEEHKDYFEKNKYNNFNGLTKYRDLGYEASYVGSLVIDDSSKSPVFFVKIQDKFSSSNFWYELYYCKDNSNNYSKYGKIKKACPEFWAQKEIEESKQSAEAESVAVEECTERDSEGNVVGFDWNAYLQKNASSHSKVDLDNSQSPSSPIRYADLELSL